MYKFEAQFIIQKILERHPFPGWRPEEAFSVVEDQMSRLEFDLLFPYGVQSLLNEYRGHLINLLSNAINVGLSKDIGVTGKIRWIFQKHFEQIISYTEAEQAAISTIYRPSSILHTPAYVGDLMDLIWRAAGDESNDINYYTKRMSLGVIYVVTLLYWYQSNASIDEIMQFFDDRLNNLKTVTTTAKQCVSTPNNIMKNFHLLRQVFWDK